VLTLQARLEIRAKRFICQSFPEGIPDEIIYGRFDHRTPHPHDDGKQFEITVDFKVVLERAGKLEEWYAQLDEYFA
jgi:hypothetical protein